MDVTRVKIFPFDTSGIRGSTRGYAEVELDGKLTIRGIRIIESKTGGLFIGWPSQKTTAGTYRDLIGFSDAELGKSVRDQIIHAFSNVGVESSDSDAKEILS